MEEINAVGEGLSVMLELAVIADDLTGAADTGIQFRAMYAPVYLVDHRFLSIDSFGEPPQALSIFTASRGLPPADAHRAVTEVCRVLGRHAPRRVYKKIDSAMRGNIGAELEAVMEAFNITMSFIAPAYAEQGRTTVGGVHCIHGTPVARSEMRRDPIAPVCESRLPDWIGFQAHLPIAHIGLDVLSQGAAAAAAAIDRAAAAGARHFTFDAAVPEDLDRIARLALNHYPQALLCGSAGLAKSMARALGSHRPHPNPGRRPADAPPAGHWLFACGSASERLRRQVQVLAEQTDAGVLALDPGGDDSGCVQENRDAAVRRAASRLAANDLVMALAPPLADSPLSDSDRLLAGFADAVHAVITAARPAGLFLSGGDTALAVLERLGAHGIRLECEISSGLVFGRLAGGAMEGMPVVTKAGAFGPPDALLKLKKALANACERGRL
jgi:uncharacterized protein YgbK (DUF1537 family)